MSQIHKHSIPANIADSCLINPEQYKAQYQQSVTDPDAYWGEQGKILDWIRPYTRVKNTSFAPGNVSIKWYEDGTLNLAANCLDRHLAELATRRRSSGKATTPARARKLPIASCIATCAALLTPCSASGLKRRRRSYLYADGARSGGRYAGLRPHWRHPLGYFRRLLAGSGGRTHHRLQLAAGDHRRRGPARRSRHSAEENVDDALKNPNVTTIENVVVLKRTGAKRNGTRVATCGGAICWKTPATSTSRKR